MNYEIAQHHDNRQQTTPEPGVSRRSFLGRAGGLAATTVAAGALTAFPLGNTLDMPSIAAASAASTARADQAYAIRVAAARAERVHPLPAHPTNGDEEHYAGTRIGNFTKGLPHNIRGEVDPAAYTALLMALESGQPAAFEAIPLGGTTKLANPQAAYAFLLEGPDPQCLAVAPPPAFASAWQAAEMAELYWLALARDVPFARYTTHPLMATAAADLSRLSGFHGPKAGVTVTPATLFRGGVPGDLSGPYLSQFFWLPVPYGPMKMAQQYPIVPTTDHMTTFAAWLDVQQGRFKAPKPKASASPPPTRYLSTGRDLAAYLHVDFTYQAFLNAALILNKLTVDELGAPLDAGNPYRHSRTQAGGPTFGSHHVLELVARVANSALKAVYYQKWLVHRRLRPEEFGGRVHVHQTGAASYPIHADLLHTSRVLDMVHQTYGAYLLPMADPEGCPMHPSYPAAHVVMAGACATVLKAFFDEAFVLPAPVLASADGRTLLPYSGPALTVGGELNKLASNHQMARSWEGFHWRTDGAAALHLGEAVALGILADERHTFHEAFGGFTLTTFDGRTITA